MKSGFAPAWLNAMAWATSCFDRIRRSLKTRMGVFSPTQRDVRNHRLPHCRGRAGEGKDDGVRPIPDDPAGVVARLDADLMFREGNHAGEFPHRLPDSLYGRGWAPLIGLVGELRHPHHGPRVGNAEACSRMDLGERRWAVGFRWNLDQPAHHLPPSTSRSDCVAI